MIEIDYFLKEQVCKVKLMTLAILNQTISDELYSKEKTIEDLKEIIDYLDKMDVPVI